MQGRDCFLFVGNPGTGKSTLINGVIGEPRFVAQPSFNGSGVTFQLDEQHIPGLGLFMDTPGLSDEKKKKQAAASITDALKKDGFYRIFFVLTDEGGRVRPADKATMKLILDAAPITDYGVIVNKTNPKWLQKMKATETLMKEWEATLMSGLPKLSVSIHFMLRSDELDGEENVKYRAPESVIDFIKQCPGMLIRSRDVKDVQADQMEALQKEHEDLIQKIEQDKDEMARQMELQRKEMAAAEVRVKEAQQQARREAEEATRRVEEAQRQAEERAEKARQQASEQVAEAMRCVQQAQWQAEEAQKQANARAEKAELASKQAVEAMRRVEQAQMQEKESQRQAEARAEKARQQASEQVAEAKRCVQQAQRQAEEAQRQKNARAEKAELASKQAVEAKRRVEQAQMQEKEAQRKMIFCIPLPYVNNGHQLHDVQFWHSTTLSGAVSASLQASWNDQGWGNQKGAIHARVRTADGMSVHKWRRIGPYPAPHNEKAIEVKIPGEFFSNQTPDDARLELGYEVGGGGGHYLHIRNAFLYLEKRNKSLD